MVLMCLKHVTLFKGSFEDTSELRRVEMSCQLASEIKEMSCQSESEINEMSWELESEINEM